MQFFKVCLVSAFVVAMSACGSPDDTGSSTQLGAACSGEDVKQWAYDNMRDYYLFADQVPQVRPQVYVSASTLIEDVRVQPYDRFSYITTTSDSQETFVEGKYFGIGYQWQADNNNRVVVSAVYEDSPLGRAGTIFRGDEFVAINGVALADMTDAQYLDFVGTREAPKAATWSFRDAQSNQLKSVSLTAALFDISTVMHSEVIDLAQFDAKVGYILFDSFLSTSEAELDAELEQFSLSGVNELILDLRYNGGGLVSIATKLASQIGGAAVDGEMLMEYRHNDDYAEYNFALDFSSEQINLDLDRLIVLTSEYTASSSEIVINALKPYMEVVTIGSRTNGKPYITFGNDYCGKQMHALQAEGFNANGVSVYGGIAPNCAAADDLSRNFGYSSGDQSEGMLQAALNYITSGACDTAVLANNEGLQNDAPASFPISDLFTEKKIGKGALVERR